MTIESPLSPLSEEELEELCKTPIWVSILITGADDKFSGSEIKSAVNLIKQAQKAEDNWVREFYQVVAERFEVDIKGFITLMPDDHDERTAFLVEKLAQVNHLFDKIEKGFASKLYQSYRKLAIEVAQASGGFFGLMAVSAAETEFIDFSMIREPHQN
jgi:hypothetical protein